MRPPVIAVHEIVAALPPLDDLEATHQRETLRWLERTDDVFRRAKPATPPRHLVSYVVPVTPDGDILLVDHVNAGLWLPPGGHVDPDEHPAATARREAREELGVAVEVWPVFLTATRTVGLDAGHTDVSIWWVAASDRGWAVPESDEFREARWWTPEEIAAAGETFDPHFRRFVRKLRRDLAPPGA
ncbi:NUDIX hydrolase [Phytohabitans sp. ZYX-F-186]|uniref:NUDIX hydrolase n=1 Tax=Phytohabitans maris TaxID=3071409 RepID=A0ABU0ZPP9_9ACTN|nr:NUDIX hydrolase [Phytohabitans sp. ZYX-F-186]MDQ7908706.1 NUDIX hydrolase [Phytohabitans sp. ZYX-F-186]